MTRTPGSIDPDTARRLRSILAERGVEAGTAPAEPHEAHEPGHPEYHRRRRAQFALGRWAGATPRRYQDATATDPQVVAWADAVIADPLCGRSLLITGSTGTGKTHQAYGALRRIAEAGPENYDAVAVAAPDLYGELRAAGSAADVERRIGHLCRVPLLYLDDLGAAKRSEWVEEITYRIINGRYNAMLPTALTTNLPTVRPEQPKNWQGVTLPEALGDRVTSRLVEMCDVVAMAGPDRRYTRT